MKFESERKTPWENDIEKTVSFQNRKDTMSEAERLGWNVTEKLQDETEHSIFKQMPQNTMHFKNNVIPQNNSVPGIALAIKEEVVKRIKQHVVDTAKRKEEEAKKKEKNNGSPILLVLCGILFAFVFLLVAPMILFMAEFSAVEPKIVTAAKKELAVSEENIGGIKYKEWYGVDDDWCAIFVSWCSNECELLEENIMPKSCSVQEMSDWYKENSQWKDATNYIPKAGDIIFFQNDMSHVGIVISYDTVNKIITTVEGNAGESDTTLEHGHDWQIEFCQICDGDHLASEEIVCVVCDGKGYLLRKSGDENVYEDYSTIMEYTGCGSCGGNGKVTNYYNQFGLAWNEGYMNKGTGKIGENIFCTACFGVGPYMGMAARCNTPDCIKSSYAAWEDFPDGVCYTTECEYHEASRVTMRQYPLTYTKISGYGIPAYYMNWLNDLFSGE